MGPRCTWVFLFHLIYVIDSITCYSRCREYWSTLLSICRVCIYMYARLVMSSYQFCCIYIHDWCIACFPKRDKIQKFTQRIPYIYARLVIPSDRLFCCVYLDAWCITCFPKRDKLQKFTQRIPYIYARLVIPSYRLFCCIYLDAWCITCCSK